MSTGLSASDLVSGIRNKKQFTGRFDEIKIRNLLYHVYPCKDNDVWYKNVRQLKSRLDLFNGRKVIGVMTGPDCLSVDHVRSELDCDVEYICIPNDPNLASDVITFRTLLPLLYSTDPNTATFFAHTKGTTRDDIEAIACEYWRNAMYHFLLDNWPVVSDTLRNFAMAGCYKLCSDQKQRFPDGIIEGGYWHYSGTFFWLRNDVIFNRSNWYNIPYNKWGAEAWPGYVCDSHEAASIFQPWDYNDAVLQYYPHSHPVQINDDISDYPTIHIGTSITVNYLSRALPFLSTLHCCKEKNKFCICLGFHPPDWLINHFSTIKFQFMERDVVESYGMIQHGPWLDACPWIGDNDLCAFVDSDILIQRGFNDELIRFNNYTNNTIGLTYNAGCDDTLSKEAKRIGLDKSYNNIYDGDWDNIPCYNCGVIIARASVFNKLRVLYEHESSRFHEINKDRSRCQWLICWLIHKMGLEVDDIGPYTHDHGHFGIKDGYYYDSNGNYRYNRKLIMFRHVL